MPQAGTETLNEVARDLHQFVSLIQNPRIEDQNWSSTVRKRCDELVSQVSTVSRAVDGAEKGEPVRDSLDKVCSGLKAYARELEGRPNASRLKETWQSLSRSYEELLIHIRKRFGTADGMRLSHLKPRNYARNLFHVLMGLTGSTLYEFWLTWGQAMAILGTLLGIFVTLEITRRAFPKWNDFLLDRVFSMILRPRERHGIPSATYYLAALTLVTLLMPKHAVVVGLLVLAFGDPAATLVGKRWGRTKIWFDKSLEGCLAFFALSFAVSIGFLLWREPAMGLGSRMALAASVSVVGALAELFSDRLDDNFTIPLLCSGLAYFWF